MTPRDPAINIVLIGMPGSGKSTVGVLLAKRLGYGFVDTDLLIQQRAGRTLQQIVDGDGYRALRKIEEEVLLDLDVERHVVATGGSAVYSSKAMAVLRESSVAVFLDIPLPVVLERVGDHSGRGISRRPDQTLEALFEERFELYTRHADITIDGAGQGQDAVTEVMVGELVRAGAVREA